MYRHWAKIAAASLLAVSSAATAATPQLQLAHEEAYANAPSGILIDPLPGFSRKVTLFDDSGLDVGIDLRNNSADEEITYFLFRRVAGDSALWLDRIGKVIAGQDRFGQVTPAIAPFSLALPSGAVGLGTVYGLSGKSFKATGAAVFASKDWYVAIRATSTVRDPNALKTWIAEAAGSIHWPAGQTPIAPPSPMQPCPKSIGGSDKARFHIPSLATLLTEAAMVHAVEDEKKGAIPDELKTGTWCLDTDLSPMASVYRHPSDRNAYFLALADAGRGYRVSEESLAAVLDPGTGESYFVSLIELDHVDGYAAFDRLPSPAVVLSFVRDRPYAFRATTWGEGSNITFNSDVVKSK